MAAWNIVVVGAALVCFAAVSNRLRGTALTMPIVFVGLGALTALTGVVTLSQAVDVVALLAEITLAVIMFSDATRLSLPRLQHTVALPARLLGIGLPLTVAFGSAVALLLFPEWPLAEVVLLAAVLAPTDAALGSAVVADPGVPARDRLALNVESGLNDGLVVPVVAVTVSRVIGESRSVGEWVTFVVSQIGGGIALGLVAGVGGIILLRRAHRASWSDGRYEQIATVALPVVAFAAAEAVGANGFIAAFVGGLGFGSGGPRRLVGGDRPALDDDMAGPDEAEHLAEFTEDAAELLAAVTFFVFGNLFIDEAISAITPRVVIAALASLTVVRMVPVAVALIGSGCDRAARLFIGWFGPRGLASIVFAILLLEELEEMTETANQLVGTISVTVFASVLLHGVTAAAGARAYGARQPVSRPEEIDPAMMPRVRSAPSRERG